MKKLLTAIVLCAFPGLAYAGQSAQPITYRRLDRTAYASHLRGMWLAECIANWTGLQTEGKRPEPPFFTEKDPLPFVLQNPWGADDDTDIEYIYLHLMLQHQTPHLTATQIAQGWQQNIRGTEFIWVSNASAIELMRQGVLPPATGMGAVNATQKPWEPNFLMIDAQLTTELFGAVAPGMPEYALKIADLPIRTTSAAYATHAAQHFMLMYSLAPVVDPTLSNRDKVLWLASESAKYLPATSKTADIYRFVLEDFLANCPDAKAQGCQNWEITRDRVYEHFHRDAVTNGYKYYVWYESSVNYATGLIALLYGQNDLQHTIRIGSLSGWDSDNGTATMGGLLGLLNGYDWVVSQFPGQLLSDRYNIYRTRSLTLPDYLPNDPEANDTFAMMAERTLSVVDQAVAAGGGTLQEGVYALPPLPSGNLLALSPTEKLYRSSANNQVRRQGGVVSTFSSAGSAGLEALADGVELDFSGKEPKSIPKEYRGRASDFMAGVLYSNEVSLKTLRLIGGSQGHFVSLTPQLRIDGTWRDLPAGTSRSSELGTAPYPLIDWTLPAAIPIQGIRLKGVADGSLSLIELDALSESP